MKIPPHVATIVRLVREDFALIGQRIDAIHRTLNQYIEGIDKERHRQSNREYIPAEVRAEVHLPYSVEAKRAADHKSQHTTQQIIAIAAWAAFIAALAYAFVARSQLEEMRTQTAQLFQQSEIENAGASHRAAEIFRQLNIAQQQAKATEDTSNAIVSQIRIMRAQLKQQQDAMSLEERAWVGLDINVKGPLTFTAEMVYLPLNISVTNVGHSPAQYVKPWSKLVVSLAPPSEEDLNSYCGRLKESPSSNETNGWALFPTQRKDIDQPASAPRKEIDKALAKNLIPGKVGVALIACVDYSLAFGNKVHHQTRQNYAIIWYDISKGGIGMGAFDPIGKYSPISLYLQPGSYAD